MHSFSQLFFLVTLLTTLATAAPHQKKNLAKRSFHVPLSVRNEKFERNGAAAMARAMGKYNMGPYARNRNGVPDMVTGAMTVSEDIQRPNMTINAAGGGDGKTQAVPANQGAEFLSAVMIGGQMMTMDFDTGSSDLWVFSSEQPKQQTNQHTVYTPTKSQSFNRMQGASWKIAYGDGSGAQGFVGTDEVNIGGATVTNQAVEVATSVAASFTKDTMNGGLVGLAFSNLNTVKPNPQKTFFDNAMDNLDMPVFAANLKNDNTGTYQFGNVDSSQFQGDLAFTDVDSSSGFWQIKSTKFAVNGKVTQNPKAAPAIADTGTSLLLVDDNVASAYYGNVKGAKVNNQAGGFTYPCNADLPDFSVAMGDDYMATVPGDQITFAQVDRNTCFGGVQSNMGAGIQIYGDTMFKTQYIVFNGQNKSLGMAPKVGQPPAMKV